MHWRKSRKAVRDCKGISSRCYPKIIVWMMSLSMCILWLPVIWLSRPVFPYVSVFKDGDSHPLWSCCLLGKFLWTKISELPKVTPIQEILADVGFEYKCKSWILALLYNPAFCYWFCSPNLYWSRNNTTTWNDFRRHMCFFFQVVTLQAWGWPRLVVVPLIFADVCLMHARDPRGNIGVRGGGRVWPLSGAKVCQTKVCWRAEVGVDFCTTWVKLHWVFT